MQALSEVITILLLSLSGVTAFVLGVCAGSLSSRPKRFAGLVVALLLVVPVCAGLMFLGIVELGAELGPDAFAWWLAGLRMIAVPWCIAAFAGFALCALRRRQRRG